MTQTISRIRIDGKEFILIGTAHISKESINEVVGVIRSENPDRICVELDQGRLDTIEQKRSWENLNIAKVLKDGKGFLMLANLTLSSFQKRMGADVGVSPGEEMQAAIKAADEASIPTSLVDRPITVTLQRAWKKSSFWGKIKLLTALLSSAFSKEELDPESIEKLKEQSEMDSMMSELADYLPSVKEALIDERDRYLAAKIFEAPGTKIVAVLGAGHIAGVTELLQSMVLDESLRDVSQISAVPPSGIGSKIAGWIIPAIIVAILIAGFFTGGGKTTLQMIVRWWLWNGSLAALGSAAALAHPLTILVSFVCAPIGTLNPFLAVGLFSGLTEAQLRKPVIADMEKLNEDVTTPRGFYKNRITRILLVFFFSSLGGAIGNFISIPSLASVLFKK